MDKEIRVRRSRSPVWEDIDDAPPHDQGIARCILWQPYKVWSSLGVWWWNVQGVEKMVIIREGV